MIKEPTESLHCASVTDIALMRRRKIIRQESKPKMPWFFGRDSMKKMQRPCQIIPFPVKQR